MNNFMIQISTIIVGINKLNFKGYNHIMNNVDIVDINDNKFGVYIQKFREIDLNYNYNESELSFIICFYLIKNNLIEDTEKIVIVYDVSPETTQSNQTTSTGNNIIDELNEHGIKEIINEIIQKFEVMKESTKQNTNPTTSVSNNDYINEFLSNEESKEYYFSLFKYYEIYTQLTDLKHNLRLYILPNNEAYVNCSNTVNVNDKNNPCYKLIDSDNNYTNQNEYTDNNILFDKCSIYDDKQFDCKNKNYCDVVEISSTKLGCVPKVMLSKNAYDCDRLDKDNCNTRQHCFFIDETGKCLRLSNDILKKNTEEKKSIPNYIDCNYFNNNSNVSDNNSADNNNHMANEYCPRDFCNLKSNGNGDLFKCENKNTLPMQDLSKINNSNNDNRCELINNTNNNRIERKQECNAYNCKFDDTLENTYTKDGITYTNKGLCVSPINGNCIFKKNKPECINSPDNCKWASDTSSGSTKNLCIPNNIDVPCEYYNADTCPIDDYIDIYGYKKTDSRCKKDDNDTCVNNTENTPSGPASLNNCLFNYFENNDNYNNYNNCYKDNNQIKINNSITDNGITDNGITDNGKLLSNSNIPCSLLDKTNCFESSQCKYVNDKDKCKSRINHLYDDITYDTDYLKKNIDNDTTLIEKLTKLYNKFSEILIGAIISISNNLSEGNSYDIIISENDIKNIDIEDIIYIISDEQLSKIEFDLNNHSSERVSSKNDNTNTIIINSNDFYDINISYKYIITKSYSLLDAVNVFDTNLVISSIQKALSIDYNKFNTNDYVVTTNAI
jgi:hypothetical protein